MGVVAIASLLLVNSCTKVKNIHYKNYVQTYNVSLDIAARTYWGSVVSVDFSSYTVVSKFVSFNSKGEDKKEFERLCQKNRDVSYSKHVKYIGPIEINRAFFAVSVQSVKVTSDRDWDEAHPAGTPLNDLIAFVSGSPDKFINSGYQVPTIDESIFELARQQHPNLGRTLSLYHNGVEGASEPIYGELSQIDFSQYNLMGIDGSFAAFEFDKYPDDDEAHKITIEITFENGTVSQATTEWSKPEQDSASE